jgi:hypothetical protein
MKQKLQHWTTVQAKYIVPKFNQSINKIFDCDQSFDVVLTNVPL